jgi:hypothetical protein
MEMESYCDFINTETEEFKNRFYPSYRHNEYAHIWTETMVHGHRSEAVIITLTKILSDLKEEGYEPEIPVGMDGFSINKSVFAYHLDRLKKMCKKYPNHLLYSCDMYDSISEFDYSKGESMKKYVNNKLSNIGHIDDKGYSDYKDLYKTRHSCSIM